MSVFESLLGPEPSWLRCGCGELTSRVPCWTCQRVADARTDQGERVKASLGSIPPRFAWATLASPELAGRVRLKHSPLDTVVRRVLAASRVVFAGPSGAGKTSLAVACLRERVPHGMYLSALRLGTARIQTPAGGGEAIEVQKALGTPLLLLDEVGGESKTATNAVRDVIFARHDADLPTWVTTGFTKSQLAEMYGDGALRRLTEDAYVVQLGGPINAGT